MQAFNAMAVTDAYRQFVNTADELDGFSTLLNFLQDDDAITDLRWAAYMLATVKWECSGAWQPIQETSRGKGMAYGVPVVVTDQNGVSYTNVYYGRGYVQLTWRANYDRMSQALGLGSLLVVHPEHALDPRTAYTIMSLGMRQGMFTGAGLARFINSTGCDYVNARKIINGLDQAERIATFASGFEKLLTDNLGRANLPTTVSALGV
jgi:hypothetical protein